MVAPASFLSIALPPIVQSRVCDMDAGIFSPPESKRKPQALDSIIDPSGWFTTIPAKNNYQFVFGEPEQQRQDHPPSPRSTSQPSTVAPESKLARTQSLSGASDRLIYSQERLLAIGKTGAITKNPAWQENFDMVKSNSNSRPIVNEVKVKVTPNGSDESGYTFPSRPDWSPPEPDFRFARLTFSPPSADALDISIPVLLLEAAQTHFEYVCRTLKGGVSQEQRIILNKISKLLSQLRIVSFPTRPDYVPVLSSYSQSGQGLRAEVSDEARDAEIGAKSGIDTKILQEVEAPVPVEEDEKDLQARKARIADSMLKRRKEQILHEDLLQASKSFEAAQKKKQIPVEGSEAAKISKDVPVSCPTGEDEEL
ncbi:MAG: hypothetical protein Q9222_005057 [Ikaeria aurantiellina]